MPGEWIGWEICISLFARLEVYLSADPEMFPCHDIAANGHRESAELGLGRAGWIAHRPRGARPEKVGGCLIALAAWNGVIPAMVTACGVIADVFVRSLDAAST